MSSKQSPAGPRRGRHEDHDDSLDEEPQSLDDQPADIERAIPVEENESVEEIEDAEEDPVSSMRDCRATTSPMNNIA